MPLTRNMRGLAWLLAAVLATTASAQMMTTTPTAATLTVSGHSELMEPADQVRLSIGVVTQDPDARKALDENSRQMRLVVEAIEKTGLDEEEYKTGRFQVRPLYSRRPRQADADWRPRIIGYEVTNTLAIKTGKLELAGDLIEAANAAGANSIDRLQFAIADPREFRAAAITKAAAHARADARVLAEASGVRLLRPLTVTLDGASARPPAPMAVARAMASESAAPPIAPGDISITASVTIVYEIVPAE